MGCCEYIWKQATDSSAASARYSSALAPVTAPDSTPSARLPGTKHARCSMTVVRFSLPQQLAYAEVNSRPRIPITAPLSQFFRADSKIAASLLHFHGHVMRSEDEPSPSGQLCHISGVASKNIGASACRCCAPKAAAQEALAAAAEDQLRGHVVHGAHPHVAVQRLALALPAQHAMQQG